MDKGIAKVRKINKMIKSGIMERPKCVKCGKNAMCLLYNNWVCCDCLLTFNDKKNKIVLEMLKNGN